MIIDSHCHAGAGFGLKDPWTGQPLFERYLRRAAAAGITHSALFGSDGPWLHPGLELTKIRALRLSPTDEALVLGGNFLRLIGAGFHRAVVA